LLLLLLLQVLASCLWLGHGEVVTSLQSSCPQFFFWQTPPNAALTPQNPAWICQRYGNKYHFATLYDRDQRIPVYSAYLYQPGSGSRPNTWLVEPQLVNLSLPEDMNTEGYVLDVLKVNENILRNSQAVSEDYDHLTGYHRGHLNPCSNNNNINSTMATFTLTNVVPQHASLNMGQWKRYETHTMRNMTRNCVTTYVVVGAVPGYNSTPNRRVNIPSHIWSSACCQLNNNKMKAWGVIAENNRNAVQELSLGQLENRLTQLYGNGQVYLFNNLCPR
ncbi:ENDD1 protein, partial [Hemiprocne comata]|nr:ENDD1 protein [Hemiprocne comata]